MHKRYKQLSKLVSILLLLIGISACSVKTQTYPTIFALGLVDSGFEISALNLNTGVRQYVTNSKVIAPMSFAYCSKSKQIAYSTPVEDGEEIILLDLNGSSRALTFGNNKFRFPVWSPDCSLIAVTSFGEFSKIALIQTTDGSTRILFPNSDLPMEGFSWSPDGKYAVIVTNPIAHADAVVYNLNVVDIGAETLIQDINGIIDHPFSKIAWFSTSNEFLFVANRQGDFDIYEYDLNKRVETPVVQTEKDELFPVLSPDGKTLAFLQSTSGKNSFSVNVLDLPSGSMTALTTAPMKIDALLWITDQEILVSEFVQAANQTNYYSLDISDKSLNLVASFQGQYKNPEIVIQN